MTAKIRVMEPFNRGYNAYPALVSQPPCLYRVRYYACAFRKFMCVLVETTFFLESPHIHTVFSMYSRPLMLGQSPPACQLLTTIARGVQVLSFRRIKAGNQTRITLSSLAVVLLTTITSPLIPADILVVRTMAVGYIRPRSLTIRW